MHAKYRSRGVVFLGMTSEPAESVGRIKQFLKQHRITWRNAYGARPTFTKFGVRNIPALWVVGRDGKVAWTGRSDKLDAAIETALAASTP